MLEVRNHTNNKLKYINHNNRRETDRKNPSGGNSHNSTNKHAQNKEEQLIYFTNEDENNQRNNMKRESEMCIRKIFEEEIKCGLPGVTMTSESTRICPKVPDDGNPSNFDLIQLHENPSDTLTNDSEFTQCYNAVRTQSAPEIVQTSLFVNST